MCDADLSVPSAGLEQRAAIAGYDSEPITTTNDNGGLPMRIDSTLAAAGLIALCALPALAQQDVPMRNGIPVAPSGLVIPPLPEEPVVYDTAEGQAIRVSVIARGLEQPWSIAFLPGGDMLVTERAGRLRLIRDDELVAAPVAGIPELVAGGLSAGLFDLALHPD
ncbi:MAG: PQQ-dependent sugar dehydrogenase, partial [Gammaproteobacteria bacterium]|nr:PQQ-dependent sugar dehydrogenase [Gammaproteobacteria bacterium]